MLELIQKLSHPGDHNTAIICLCKLTVDSIIKINIQVYQIFENEKKNIEIYKRNMWISLKTDILRIFKITNFK